MFSKEISEAKKSHQGFSFKYFVMICKLCRQKGQPQEEPLWSNPEEEIFHEVSLIAGLYIHISLGSLRMCWAQCPIPMDLAENKAPTP